MDWTQTLTGLLPLVVITSVLLGFPISLFLLRLYRRSVIKAMRAQASALGAAASPATPPTLQPTNSPREAPARVRTATLNAASVPAFGAAPMEPWRASGVYALAAASYAAVMTAGWLVATRDPAISWIKVLTIFWMY